MEISPSELVDLILGVQTSGESEAATHEDFLEIGPISDEEIRITIRIAASGAALIIADPRGEAYVMGRADSPSEAMEMAMKLLDHLDTRSEDE